MRVMVFFDLPVLTTADQREYRKFRKFLMQSGFLMLQESVYCKLAQNTAAGDAIVENVIRNRPSGGLVQVLRVTEKQYSKMVFVVGEKVSQVLDNDERLVVL